MSHIALTRVLRSGLYACMLVFAVAASLGNTVDAASTPRDVAREAANRQLVLTFYERFFNQHDISAASVIVDDYRQHNPFVPDGKAAVVAYFTQYFKENPQARSRIVRSVAEGDLVWLHVHATQTPDDSGRAVVDVFRVQDGRIVEHWDVIQAVPAQPANNNTMF